MELLWKQLIFCYITVVGVDGILWDKQEKQVELDINEWNNAEQ